MFDGALKELQEAPGSTHPLTMRVAYNLGNVYYRQNRPVEAEQMYKWEMRDSEQEIGPMFTLPLDAAHTQGALYTDQKKLKEAKQMFKVALQAMQEKLGLDHPLTQNTAKSLAILLKLMANQKR